MLYDNNFEGFHVVISKLELKDDYFLPIKNVPNKLNVQYYKFKYFYVLSDKVISNIDKFLLILTNSVQFGNQIIFLDLQDDCIDDCNRKIIDLNLAISHNINRIKYILEYNMYTLKEGYHIYYEQK